LSPNAAATAAEASTCRRDIFNIDLLLSVAASQSIGFTRRRPTRPSLYSRLQEKKFIASRADD
jgi:hypothetical protein